MNLFTTIENAKISYSVDGSGPLNLVLVHGAGANSKSNWGHFIEFLAPHYKVVRPNYSGSGETTDDGQPLSTAQLAEQVIAAAKAADAVPFDLIGFSLGTSVSAYIAAEYPEYVKSVVLLAPYLKGNARTKLQFELWKDLGQNNRKAMSSIIIQTGFSANFTSAWDENTMAQTLENTLQTNNWEGFIRQAELLIHTDVTAQAKKINKPTLVIGCTYDYMVPGVLAKDAAALIPHAEYAELAAGHMAVYEKPEEFLKLATEFLQKS
ncbi:alpha/beta hydrolase [Acinetobacter sp. ANC 4945]|uniref:AB hydrolase-1 domain-containing protein n=1 Tax=Acinetobacter amyesii TaxID=2942470 RepID=A0A1T1H762_9GAMM|nr:alpha/beta hydrolase [Acinetobacter amyesii]MCL6248944.1 alpha/beta hydrolase [Acinetobacter amyesii]OOV85704.1 hypothetical protein B1202_03485 [Acinetobacter amyesii]